METFNSATFDASSLRRSSQGEDDPREACGVWRHGAGPGMKTCVQDPSHAFYCQERHGHSPTLLSRGTGNHVCVCMGSGVGLPAEVTHWRDGVDITRTLHLLRPQPVLA